MSHHWHAWCARCSGRSDGSSSRPLTGFTDDVRDCLAAHELSSVAVAVVEGSATRRECVEAALENLGGESIPTPLVLVHDHRYPLAPSGVCDRVIERLRARSPVVFPALPLTDSVKAVGSSGRIIETVDRTTLRTVQYPAGFHLRVGCRRWWRPARPMISTKSRRRSAPGWPITVVDGDPDAFVVDLPRDGQLVEAIISTRQDDPR